MALPRMNSGDHTPIVKYDAKVGRFFAVDRRQGEDGKWVAVEKEIRDFEALFDFSTLEVGYGAFVNKRPDFHLIPYSEYQKTGQFPVRPPDYHEDGKVKWYSTMAQLGVILKDGSVRRFAQLSSVGYAAIADLLDLYEASPESREGKNPVVMCDGIDAIKSKHGTNYKPHWAIIRWSEKKIAPEDYSLSSQKGGASPASAPVQEGTDPGDQGLPF